MANSWDANMNQPIKPKPAFETRLNHAAQLAKARAEVGILFNQLRDDNPMRRDVAEMYVKLKNLENLGPKITLADVLGKKP